jgi:uncharacterized protein YfaS (alpha-2-macroglobulin family)
MTETVFYSSALKTRTGIINGTFKLSDLITKFRISANSFDKSGALGYSRSDFQTQKPFYIDFQLPPSMVVGDSLSIPIFAYNNMDTNVTVPLIIGNSTVGVEALMDADLGIVGPF